MFKKNDMVQINAETITRFFDLVAEQEVFLSNETNQNWLWRKMQFIIDFLNHNNFESISQEKLIELIYTEKHKLLFKENNHEFTKSNAVSLDSIIQEEPIVKILSNILSSAWTAFYSIQNGKSKKENFSKKHFFLILNICAISFIIMVSYEIFSFIIMASYEIFNLWKGFGSITLLSILGFFLYQNEKQISLQRAQKSIRKEVEITSNNHNHGSLSTEIIDKLGIEPWTNDKDVNDELRKFKNKTLHFLSIYNKKEKNRHPSMVLDVERMWKQHIPLFIDKTFENPAQKEMIVKTIQSMENVLQKHIETLFWDDHLEISAKQRYWLAKETEKNI